jgi:hypothetical protein
MKKCIICKTVLDSKMKKRFCSQECRLEYWKQRNRENKPENARKMKLWRDKNIKHYRKYQRDYQRNVYLKNKANLQKHKIRSLLRSALNNFEANEKSRSIVWKFINSSPEKTVKHLTKNGLHWKNAVISNKVKRVPVKTIKQANEVFYYKNLKLVGENNGIS